MIANQTRTIVVNTKVQGKDVIRTFQVDPRVDVLTGGRQSLVTTNGLLVAEIIEDKTGVRVSQVRGTKREFDYIGRTWAGSDVKDALTKFVASGI